MTYYHLILRARIALVLIVAATAVGWPGSPTATLAQAPSYRLVTTDGVRPLAFQTIAGIDMVELEAIAEVFDLRVRDDPRAGGAVVSAGRDRIVITSGQSTVSVGGRLVSLSAAVERDGTRWRVPIDFLRVVRRGAEVRREARLVVVPPAEAPRVTSRFDATSTGGRLTLAFDPAVPARVTRDGDRVIVRVQAQALDTSQLQPDSAPPTVVAALDAADMSIVVTLGASVTNVRADDNSHGRVTLDLIAPAAAAPPAVTPALPPGGLDRGTGIRTVVIDPGHGGEDVGVHRDGLTESSLAWTLAVRLKVTLESRLGLRVVLTRDGDQPVTIDRRAALANNNKADLFISLHANHSPVASVQGAQVLSLEQEAYAEVNVATVRPDAAPLPVPIAGGGARVVDAVPWQLAQLPHAAASATFAGIVAGRLANAGVPMLARPSDRAPLRVLVGANMPAVLIEVGTLSGGAGAAAPGRITAVVEAVAAAIADVRAGIPAGDRR